MEKSSSPVVDINLSAGQSVNISLFKDLPDSDSNKLHFKKIFNEYIVALAVEWYLENKSTPNKQEVEIGLTKLLLYPFYFVTANGHSKGLFEALGNFKLWILGPLQKEFFENYSSSNTNSKTSSFTITQDSISFEKNISQILEDIKNKDVVLPNSVEVKFKDLIVSKDSDVNTATNICVAIKQSVEALKLQSNNLFLSYDFDRFIEYTEAFKKGLSSSSSGFLDYEDVKKNRIMNSVFN